MPTPPRTTPSSPLARYEAELCFQRNLPFEELELVEPGATPILTDLRVVPGL